MLPPGRERPRSLVTGGAALLAAVLAAALLIVPATLAQRYLERSYDEPAAAALSDAHRAGRLDRLSGRPDLATARALLRTGDTAGALAAARRAAGAEPKFWVAWQVLAETAAREAQQRVRPGRACAGAAACSAAAARAPGRGAGAELRPLLIPNQPGLPWGCCAHEAVPRVDRRGSAGRRLQRRRRRCRHRRAGSVVTARRRLLDPPPLRRRPTCT